MGVDRGGGGSRWDGPRVMGRGFQLLADRRTSRTAKRRCSATCSAEGPLGGGSLVVVVAGGAVVVVVRAVAASVVAVVGVVVVVAGGRVVGACVVGGRLVVVGARVVVGGRVVVVVGRGAGDVARVMNRWVVYMSDPDQTTPTPTWV